MQVTIIITLGTSDIQFDPETLKSNGKFAISDSDKTIYSLSNSEIKIPLSQNRNYKTFTLKSCRQGAPTILQHFDQFYPVISFPLALPFIQEIHNNPEVYLKQIVLVCTNQMVPDQMEKDTIYVADVLKQYLMVRFNYPETLFEKLEITENVTDYDYQYINLGSRLENMEGLTQADKILLLPQGGIDQINTTLMLQLLRNYGKKVEIYQTREQQPTRRINFAELYTRDIILDQIALLCQKARYSSAIEILKNHFSNEYNELEGALQVAYSLSKLRINDFEALKKQNYFDILKDIFDKKIFWAPFLQKVFSNDNNAFKVSIAFEKVRFYKKINLADDFVLSLHIFIESFLNHFISETYNIKISEVTNENQFKTIIENNSDEIKKKQKNLLNSYSFFDINRRSVPAMIILAYQKNGNADKIIKFFTKLNQNFKNAELVLDKIRNDLVHNGKSPTNEQFTKLIKIFDEMEKIIADGESLFVYLNNYIEKLINGIKKNRMS